MSSSAIAWMLMGSLVTGGSPSTTGGEAGLAATFHPFPGKEITLAPKLSVLAAGGSDVTRFDVNTGLEGTLWFVNAIGSGLALSLVAPSTVTGEGASVHFRIEPTLSVRVRRYDGDGAWALRVGLPYDSQYRWALQAGISLQFSGVPGGQGSVEL